MRHVFTDREPDQAFAVSLARACSHARLDISIACVLTVTEPVHHIRKKSAPGNIFTFYIRSPAATCGDRLCRAPNDCRAHCSSIATSSEHATVWVRRETHETLPNACNDTPRHRVKLYICVYCCVYLTVPMCHAASAELKALSRHDNSGWCVPVRFLPIVVGS